MNENQEEKKCPVCGRPNLSRAEKCWYCQAPLEESSETNRKSLLSEEELLEQNGEGSSFIQSAVEEQANEQPNTTPEWLRRIRELIATDQQQEMPVDEWKQQQLFEVPEKKESKATKAFPQTAVPSPTTKNNAEIKSSNPKLEKDHPQDISPEDLPEGFTPLSTHSEK